MPSLTGAGRVELRYEKPANETIRILNDVLAVGEAEGGYVIVPSREGLLVPVKGDKAFKRAFGTSEYEGCHMNMLGLVKKDSALIVTWDDAYVFPELERTVSAGGANRLATTFELRGTGPVAAADAAGQGRLEHDRPRVPPIRRETGYAVTLREKIRRDPHVELMVGAPDVKLWTCLTRRMNEESTTVESVRVHWTFDEAARVAEHLRNDVKIDRCFFMVGGWTEGGYDCPPSRQPAGQPGVRRQRGPGGRRPADPEAGLRRLPARQRPGHVPRRQELEPELHREGSRRLADPGGRWNGGRAYMVCAPKQLELALRPQNLGAIRDLFAPWCYFIDTTYAVGPRECFDPNHPIGRNEDIAWKIRLSDYARNTFGLFGSECGREWALPHSDFFEGLVGVSGHYYANAKLPEELGAQVIPFFEMVYHDCQICYGKYGYRAEDAAEYVAHHVLCARPLYYHSFPDHLYWQNKPRRTSRREHGVGRPRRLTSAATTAGRQGLHPLDIFVKNTHEVLGPLHELTAYYRLSAFEYLTEDRNVRRADLRRRRPGGESDRQLRSDARRGHFRNRRPHDSAALGLPRGGTAFRRLPRPFLERPGLRQRGAVHAPPDGQQGPEGLRQHSRLPRLRPGNARMGREELRDSARGSDQAGPVKGVAPRARAREYRRIHESTLVQTSGLVLRPRLHSPVPCSACWPSCSASRCLRRLIGTLIP